MDKFDIMLDSKIKLSADNYPKLREQVVEAATQAAHEHGNRLKRVVLELPWHGDGTLPPVDELNQIAQNPSMVSLKAWAERQQFTFALHIDPNSTDVFLALQWRK